MQVATGCFRHLRQMFQELEETRPFELLKGQVRSHKRFAQSAGFTAVLRRSCVTVRTTHYAITTQRVCKNVVQCCFGIVALLVMQGGQNADKSVLL